MTHESTPATLAASVRSGELVVDAPGREQGAERTKDAARSGVGGANRYSNPNCGMFSSAHVEWGTPPDLRDALEKEFRFTLDPCTVGQVWDGRELSWVGHRVFCNPPYGRGLKTWLAKGTEAALAVFLLPARTDTGWFHDHALKADEIRFFRGRLKFDENHITPRDERNAAPFPSMLVIFRAGGGGAELGADVIACGTNAGERSTTTVLDER